MEMYFKRMKDEWIGLVEQVDFFICVKVVEIVVVYVYYLSIEFY